MPGSVWQVGAVTLKYIPDTQKYISIICVGLCREGDPRAINAAIVMVSVGADCSSAGVTPRHTSPRTAAITGGTVAPWTRSESSSWTGGGSRSRVAAAVASLDDTSRTVWLIKHKSSGRGSTSSNNASRHSPAESSTTVTVAPSFHARHCKALWPRGLTIGSVAAAAADCGSGTTVQDCKRKAATSLGAFDPFASLQELRLQGCRLERGRAPD